MATFLSCWILFVLVTGFTLRRSENNWRKWHEQEVLLHISEPFVQRSRVAPGSLEQTFQQWAAVATQRPLVTWVALLDQDNQPILQFPPVSFDFTKQSKQGSLLPFEIFERPAQGLLDGRQVASLAIVFEPSRLLLSGQSVHTPVWPMIAISWLLTIAAVWWLPRRIERPLAEFLRRANISLGHEVQSGGLLQRYERLLVYITTLRKNATEWQNENKMLRLVIESKVQEHAHRIKDVLRREEKRASTDPLTGMANRQSMNKRLPRAFEQSIRDGLDVSILMIDLDNFKYLNDTLGHQAGDELLQQAGKLMLDSIGKDDLAFRYGGDEFLLFLPGRKKSEAADIAHSLLATFGHRTRALGCSAKLSMSVGVASREDHPELEGLIRCADEALYRAKSAGKSEVHLWQSMSPRATA